MPGVAADTLEYIYLHQLDEPAKIQREKFFGPSSRQKTRKKHGRPWVCRDSSSGSASRSSRLGTFKKFSIDNLYFLFLNYCSKSNRSWGIFFYQNPGYFFFGHFKPFESGQPRVSQTRAATAVFLSRQKTWESSIPIPRGPIWTIFYS